MKPETAFWVGACLVAALTSAQGQTSNASEPPPPSIEVPDLRTVNPVVVCGNCDQPFDTSTHKEVLQGLVSNKYIGELRKALYWQDTYHQSKSKAHFDNCAFNEAVGYMESLLAEVDSHVQSAKVANEQGDAASADAALVKAFFALGQTLHGVQDFYAHTNYVELSVSQVKKSTDIEVIAPWKPEGKQRIAELVSKPPGKALVSGVVFWGFPQICPNGTLSHKDMAKDKATTTSGMLKVAHLQNRNQYQIAVQLAREASQELIDYAFRKWPLMKKANGENVAFEVLVDRRGL
ncbi:HET-C-related protein [Azohydromonas australica]|uniref:HET-C-related protein n=1 Tax=Azohydromonas australica TaxID=364039 RepID=UPI0012EB516C|nr:HET-C-related protein [Azohydromonas australica]